MIDFKVPPFAMTLGPLPVAIGARILHDTLDDRFPSGEALSAERVMELVSSIDAMRTPFPMFRLVHHRMYSSLPDVALDIKTTAAVQVFDRQYPDRTLPLNFTKVWTVTLPAQRDRVIREVYELLKEAFRHELDESFLVCGERVYDPHRGPDGANRI